MDGENRRRRVAGGFSMAGMDAGGGFEPRGAGPAAGGAEPRAERLVSEGPLGRVSKTHLGDGRAVLKWELPEGVPTDRGSGVASAVAPAMDLRGAVRKVVDFRDGAVWLADDGEKLDEEPLDEWAERFGADGVPEGYVFAFARALGEFFDAQAKRDPGRLPKRFVPGRVLVRSDTDGVPSFLLEEYAVADAVRAALRDQGRPTDAAADDVEWRAPEARGRGRTTAASVQWTLARMAYRMLSGRGPGRGPFRKIARLDAGQNAALARALSEEPEKRFASCGDFAVAFETGRLPKPSHAGRNIAVAAALLLAAGAAAGVWQAARIRGERTEAVLPTGNGGKVEELPTNELAPGAAAKLEEARAARADKRWEAARNAAEAVLAADPGHEEARTILEEADAAVAPWLRIEADRPGAWIVRNGEKVRLPTSIRLERGAREGPWDVRAEDGGTAWAGFIPEFRVEDDWLGERVRRVTLESGEAGAGAERKRRTVTLPGGKTFTMIWCPPGTFTMGEAGSGNEREVRLTRGFWLAEREFTVGEWKTVRMRTPSSVAKWDGRLKRPVLKNIDGLPVENVSWEECREFIGELNASGCDLDLVFRLPTEAEWEYACRAGTPGAFDGEADEEAWFDKNAKWVRVTDKTSNVAVAEIVPPQPGGEKKANAWGFFDMHGNVSEWCADAWEEGWWTRQDGGRPLVDPTGPAAGEGHVTRGGDVGCPEWKCSSFARQGAPKPQDRFGELLAPFQKEDRSYVNIGFRLAADEI